MNTEAQSHRGRTEKVASNFFFASSLRLCVSVFASSFLLLLSGCFTIGLADKTTTEEVERPPEAAYISPRGDLILQSTMEIAPAERRYIIVSEKTLADAIAKRKSRNKEELPKVTLSIETEHRYVTDDPKSKSFVTKDLHVLDGVSPPIPLTKNGKLRETIPYDWQNEHAELEVKGLLLGTIHFGRTPGQKAAFAAGLLPCVALDIVTSPVQLVVGAVILIDLNSNYGHLMSKL